MRDERPNPHHVGPEPTDVPEPHEEGGKARLSPGPSNDAVDDLNLVGFDPKAQPGAAGPDPRGLAPESRPEGQ